MLRYFFLFILLLLCACGGQTKEEMLHEGSRLREEGNVRGSIVLFRSALEKDPNFIDARVGLADAYLASGQLEKAEKEFQKVLKQAPSEPEPLLKLTEIYLAKKEPERALLELEKYHENNSETADSLNLSGMAHAASGDLDTAEDLFNKAVLKDETAISPRINLAKVYVNREDFNHARALLREAISLDPADTEPYYMLASIESKIGERLGALEVYKQLLTANPQEVQALYMIGLLQLDFGQTDAVKKTIDKLLTFSDRAEGYRLQGMLLYQENLYEEAKRSLEKSLSLEPHLLSYFFLGLSYFSLEQYELALNQFQKTLDINPEFNRARILVGLTLLKQDRLDDAIIEIQKVLRQAPDNAYAYNVLGSAYLAQGNFDEGMKYLERAVELKPDLADAHMKRGMSHLAHGEELEGAAALQKAVAAAPDVLNSRLLLVSYYLRQKNYTAAIEVLESGLNDSPRDALLYNYLAAAYFAQNNATQAVAALQKARQVNPDYLTPAFNLASYYASQSQYQKAIQEYRNILSNDPKNIKALLGMAALYEVQGQSAEGEKIYRQLAESHDDEAILAAALHKVRQKDVGEGLRIVNQALEKDHTSVPLLKIKGDLHLQLSQMVEAENAYRQLSSISPEVGSRLLLGLYLREGKLDSAQELVRETLRSEPGKDFPYLLSATLLTAQGKSDAAINELQKGIAAVEDATRLQMRLGQVFGAAGKPQQAEQVFQGIVENNPMFAPGYAALGFLSASRGDMAQARDQYQTALRYDGNNVPALNNLAYLLVDNFGQMQEALELAMRAYRLQPSDPRIMDTLGYVLLKNNRLQDALNLLTKANAVLPKDLTVMLHLATAQKELGEHDEAKKLLAYIIDSGNEQEAAEAKKILQAF